MRITHNAHRRAKPNNLGKGSQVAVTLSSLFLEKNYPPMDYIQKVLKLTSFNSPTTAQILGFLNYYYCGRMHDGKREKAISKL